MRIFLGIIGIVLSFVIVVYREPIVRFIGHIQWAESKLGPGGTYSLMVIMGLLLFFFSLMYMTNSFDVLFGGVGVSFFDSAS